MEEDLQDFPGLPRLTYYAGVLRYDLAMAGDAGDGDAGEVAREAVKILQRRARDAGRSQEEKQQRQGKLMETHMETDGKMALNRFEQIHEWKKLQNKMEGTVAKHGCV